MGQLKEKKRDSNFELLRLVAMLMVVQMHVNYGTMRIPTYADVVGYPVDTFTRIFFQQVSVVGVNLFVLISGWFGIRPSLKRVVSMFYQVAFWGVISTGLAYALGLPLLWGDIAKSFFFGSTYWFITAYVALCVIAPILNSYVEHTHPRSILLMLMALFFLEAIYEWILQTQTFGSGYSAFAFVGLYIAARYLRLYDTKLLIQPASRAWGGYLLATAVPAVIAFASIRFFGEGFHPLIYCSHVVYTSPFVVVASLCLFLAFARLSFYSRVVNWLAGSVFSVYLFHEHPALRSFFRYDFMGAIYSAVGKPQGSEANSLSFLGIDFVSGGGVIR